MLFQITFIGRVAGFIGIEVVLVFPAGIFRPRGMKMQIDFIKSGAEYCFFQFVKSVYYIFLVHPVNE